MTPDSSTEPERRPPAPAGLELVKAFVNTAELEPVRDELTTPAGVHRWLVDQQLMDDGPAALSDADVASVVELREAIRTLLMVNSGDPSADEDEALTVLDDRASAGGLCLRFEAGCDVTYQVTVQGVAGAQASVAALVAKAMADQTWPRMKACRSDTCRWAFYDHSKNRSGSWCDMALCGSRAKMRAYRGRRKAETD